MVFRDGRTTASAIPPHPPATLGKGHPPAAQGALAWVWAKACSGTASSVSPPLSYQLSPSELFCFNRSGYSQWGKKGKDTPLLLVLLPTPELSTSLAALNIPYFLVKLHSQETKGYEGC